MFKEKYLIFKDAPRSAPHVGPKSKENVPQNPKQARTEHADKNLAEDMVLTPEKKADIFTLRLVMPHLLKSYPNRDKDTIYKSDMVQDELIPVLEAGYVGACNYSFHPNQHGFVLKSDNPDFEDMVFDFTRYDSNLNYPGKKPEKASEKVAKQGETPEKAKELTEKFIKEHMLAYLRSKRPKIKSDKGLMTNYLITQEVKPILEAGYERAKAYKFYESAEGFMLKSEDYEQRFDLNDYDDYLTLKAQSMEAAEKKRTRQLVYDGFDKSNEASRIENAEINRITDEKFADEAEFLKANPNPNIDEIRNQIAIIQSKNKTVADLPIDQMINKIEEIGASGGNYSDLRDFINHSSDVEVCKQVVSRAKENKDYEALAASDILEDLFEKVTDAAGIKRGGGHDDNHIPDDYTDENGRRYDDDSDL